MGVFGALSDANTGPNHQRQGSSDGLMREQIKVTFERPRTRVCIGARILPYYRSLWWIRVFGRKVHRGKHDVWNSVASGCITGAALQATGRGGGQTRIFAGLR
jgi:hypothetical protein